MPGRAARQQRKAERTLTAKRRSQSSRERSVSSPCGRAVPALSTSPSRWPRACSADRTSDSHPAGSARSARMAVIPGRRAQSRRVSSSACSQPKATAQPSRKKRSTAARPMPREPPVISTVLIMSSSLQARELRARIIFPLPVAEHMRAGIRAGDLLRPCADSLWAAPRHTAWPSDVLADYLPDSRR